MDVRIGGININTVPFCIIDSLNDKSPNRKLTVPSAFWLNKRVALFTSELLVTTWFVTKQHCSARKCPVCHQSETQGVCQSPKDRLTVSERDRIH